MGRKIVEIKKQEKMLIWLAEENADYNLKVTLHDGCQALIICDGGINEYLRAGSTVINPKSFFGKPIGGKWQVYGVDTSSRQELVWGTSVKYEDTTVQGASIVIRANGECYARIENGKALFAKRKGDDMEDSELVDAIRPKLCDVAKAVIQERASTLASHQDISAATLQIADAIKKNASRFFEDEFGVELLDSRVEMKFDGLEEFLKKKNMLAGECYNTKIASEQASQVKLAADALNSFDKKSSKENKKDEE